MNKENKRLMDVGEKMRTEINTMLIKGDFPQDRSKELWQKINLLINNEIKQDDEFKIK